VEKRGISTDFMAILRDRSECSFWEPIEENGYGKEACRCESYIFHSPQNTLFYTPFPYTLPPDHRRDFIVLQHEVKIF